MDVRTRGSCLCGAVTVEIDGPVLRMAQCHCRDCRRGSGTGHMSNAFFRDESVRIDGPLASHASTADSGNVNTRYFCPTCGSRVSNTVSGRDGIKGIAVGLLEDTSWFEPNAILFAAEAPAWDLTATDAPRFDGMPPPPPPK